MFDEYNEDDELPDEEFEYGPEPELYLFHVGTDVSGMIQGPVVTLTPKSHFERTGYLYDQHVDADLPECVYGPLMESIFECDSTKTVDEVKEAMVEHGFVLDQTFWDFNEEMFND